jgi:hypothetical protein
MSWVGDITVSQWQMFSSRQALDLDTELAGGFCEEMAREQWNVIAPLAQRRQPQPDHV